MQFLYWTKCRNANPFPFPFISRVVWCCLRDFAFVFSQWQWLFFLLARFGIKVWQLGKAGGPTETARASMGSGGERSLIRGKDWMPRVHKNSPERSRNVTVVLIGWPQRLLRLGGTPREKECDAQTRTQDDSSAFIHRYLYVGPKLPAPYFCFAKGHVLEPCQLWFR